MSKPKFPRCAIGNRYGRLVVLELISMPKNARALCQCDCGEKVTRQRGALVRGDAISCGCPTPLQLILEAIEVETDACIEAPTCKNGSGGYGVFRINGRVERAHRHAYAHANGLQLSDINGKVIMHTCDNPPCVNPRHLVEGTHLDNMKDMFAKGRRQAAVGERAANVKLTEQQVREIKRRLSAGESDVSIAKDFPVERGQIRYIRVGKSWRHVK
jgi:hypothetical protein